MLIVSSDGHTTARMEDYREYLDPQFRDEFDEFCAAFRELGSHSFEPRALLNRTDPDVVDEWIEKVLDTERVRGGWDPHCRLAEQDREGISAEVLIPDFGLPFELYSPALAAAEGYSRRPDQVDAGNRAYNRWLADFCSVAPERFAAMAAVTFTDIDAALEEIAWAKEHGFRGVMIPAFDEEDPLFGSKYDPVWSALEDHELVANSHIGISATSTRTWTIPVEHPAQGGPLWRAINSFYCTQILDHLVWGGVLERHPRLKVVFTEQGSGWFPGKLEGMDYSYSGSYSRRDIREVVKRPPSEYFQRQCWIGSSLLSRAEIEHRASIGVDKMMIGVDYPHHEGMWHGPTTDYLRATLGAGGVPEGEARQLLAGNAIAVYGLDETALERVAAAVGPEPADVLTPPTEDRFPRGDVHKPITGTHTL